MIPLNKVKIDSFRLLIPFELIKVIDTTFESKVFAKIYDTGEIEELENQEIKSTIFKTITGINCRFSIHYHFNEKREQQKYLGIIVNAKMLKEDYFTGINKSNIHKTFEFINSTGVIEINKEDFINAKVVDTDICIDLLLKNSTCKQLVTTIHQIAIPKKETSVISFNSKTNTGIQFGHRLSVGKSYLNKQFLKYYAKLVSLKYDTKNIEFFETYIKPKMFEKTLFADQQEYKNPFNDDNLVRMETTLKNKDHWKTYGKKVETLKDLIQLELDYSYFKRPQAIYMTAFKNIVEREDLTPTERLYLIHMKTLSNLYSIDVQDTIPFVVNEIFPYKSESKALKQERSRLKQKLLTLTLCHKEEIVRLNKDKNVKMQLEFEKFNLIPNS